MFKNPAQLQSNNLNILPQSLTIRHDCEFAITIERSERQLAVWGNSDILSLFGFEGNSSELQQQSLLLGPLSPHNAAALRKALPWLNPQTLGLHTSAGMGDRLGLATPGHVRAVQQTGAAVAPIFAQQSIREMTRTGRTPQQVMDDAAWGIFQEGWQHGSGADADHLKTTADIDRCLEAGFTFYTIDPGDFVNNQAESSGLNELYERLASYPHPLQLDENGLLNKSIVIDGLHLVFSELVLLRAMVKYGLAIWHVKQMYDHLKAAAGSRPFELEVSVDETEQPTSHAEHFYIASELKRLGVQWVSLAPRYVGRFEKGVDYIGDLAHFERDIKGHAIIARSIGPYKLSIHSGSDKFSIYPLVMRYTRGLAHLKTAGTSYLEALHTIADLDEGLMCEIYRFARGRYETDKLSYHVSAQLAKAPVPEKVSNWAQLIEQFDAREILHVTFGSVLTEKNADGSPLFYERMMSLLNSNPEAYAQNLQAHFVRHLQPFAG